MNRRLKDIFIGIIIGTILYWLLTGCVKVEYAKENTRLIKENSKAIAKHHPTEETAKTLKEVHAQETREAAVLNKEAVAKAFKMGAASVGSVFGVPPIVTDTGLGLILGLFGLNKLNARRKKKKESGAI